MIQSIIHPITSQTFALCSDTQQHVITVIIRFVSDINQTLKKAYCKATLELSSSYG